MKTYIVTIEMTGLGPGTVTVTASSLESVYNNLKKVMPNLRRIIHVERKSMVNDVKFNLKEYE